MFIRPISVIAASWSSSMARAKLEFNSREFSEAVQAAADRMKRSAYVELEKLANRIKKIAEFETPVDTGQTAASWYVEMTMTPTGPQATIGNGSDVAFLLEFGTEPHVIRVKNAQVLADEYGNIFGTEVFHPGTRAYRMLGQAMLELGYTLEGLRITA